VALFGLVWLMAGFVSSFAGIFSRAFMEFFPLSFLKAW